MRVRKNPMIPLTAVAAACWPGPWGPSAWTLSNT